MINSIESDYSPMPCMQAVMRDTGNRVDAPRGQAGASTVLNASERAMGTMVVVQA